MRSNFESRRCGCGSIIGLRESCAACASKQREQLHAAGFCRIDGTGQPPLGVCPPWLRGVRGVRADMEPRPNSQPVFGTCSFETALADMQARPGGYGHGDFAVYACSSRPGAEFHWNGLLFVLEPLSERFVVASLSAVDAAAAWTRVS